MEMSALPTIEEIYERKFFITFPDGIVINGVVSSCVLHDSTIIYRYDMEEMIRMELLRTHPVLQPGRDGNMLDQVWKLSRYDTINVREYDLIFDGIAYLDERKINILKQIYLYPFVIFMMISDKEIYKNEDDGEDSGLGAIDNLLGKDTEVILISCRSDVWEFDDDLSPLGG
jgi:hypothetical protein